MMDKWGKIQAEERVISINKAEKIEIMIYFHISAYEPLFLKRNPEVHITYSKLIMGRFFFSNLKVLVLYWFTD